MCYYEIDGHCVTSIVHLGVPSDIVGFKALISLEKRIMSSLKFGEDFRQSFELSLRTGAHKFSKNLGATSKFRTPYWRNKEISQNFRRIL